MLHVRHGDESVIGFISVLLEHRGLRGIDCSEGDFFEPATSAQSLEPGARSEIEWAMANPPMPSTQGASRTESRARPHQTHGSGRCGVASGGPSDMRRAVSIGQADQLRPPAQAVCRV